MNSILLIQLEERLDVSADVLKEDRPQVCSRGEDSRQVGGAKGGKEIYKYHVLDM